MMEIWPICFSKFFSENPLKKEKIFKNGYFSFSKQFEHEFLLRHFSRLDQFHHQSVDGNFEKWQIFYVIFEGLNCG